MQGYLTLALQCYHDWQKMKESPITGMKITNFTKCMCEACIMSKLKDISHPSKVRHKATAPYEVLWSDLAGPLKIPTRNGEQYVLGIVDEFSRWVWVFLLKTKDEATEKFDEFLTRHSNVKHLISVSLQLPGPVRTSNNLVICDLKPHYGTTQNHTAPAIKACKTQ